MAEEWISTHGDLFNQKKGVVFAITSKKSGKLMGAISLTGISEGHQAELGYWIGKQYWGNGFCTEAGAAVIDYAFSTLRLIRVKACHFAGNPASGKIMKNLGMSFEGSRKKHILKQGKFIDLELYGILKTNSI